MGTQTFPTSYLPTLEGQKPLTLHYVTFRFVSLSSLRSLRFVTLRSVTFRYVASRDVSGRAPYVRPASRGRSVGGWLLFCVLVAGARAGRPVDAAQRLLQPTIRPSSPSQGRATRLTPARSCIVARLAPSLGSRSAFPKRAGDSGRQLVAISALPCFRSRRDGSLPAGRPRSSPSSPRVHCTSRRPRAS